MSRRAATMNGFLSTPSARRATRMSWSMEAKKWYFYPRPPRGGRLGENRFDLCNQVYFYPRPPRGGRQTPIAIAAAIANFYPRPPRGGRPGSLNERSNRIYFYPRPPRGGRLNHAIIIFPPLSHFYPRPPRGGRHGDRGWRDLCGSISIHALREEGDELTLWLPLYAGKFLSTPSARRAT